MGRSLRVRVVGASSPFSLDRLRQGAAVLRGAGFDVDDDDVVAGSHAYLNGADDDRVAALDAAFADPAVDVVWCARGGYGLTRIIDRLAIPPRLPVVVGFSDVTALFARLHNEGHAGRCVHGPLCTSIVGEATDSVAHVVEVVRAVVEGRAAGDAAVFPRLQRQLHNRVVGLPSPAAGGPAPVVARGPLFAGNLCVLAALCGTKQQPDLRGHVVVVEEVGERPYRLDRMLTQCLQAGLFDGVAAVVVGHLTQCEEPAPPANTGTSNAPPSLGREPAPRALDVVVERLSTLGVPVWSGLPSGHEAPNLALPLGRPVVVEGDRLQLLPPGGVS